MSYTGRFAPSPTGSLHFGSLVAAVASYCDAKANNGQWIVRMEDLDKPREVAGAADTILQQLESFGFEWDGEIFFQSQRTAIYEEYLYRLKRNGFVYACTCSRKEIADSGILSGVDGTIYRKTCFNKKDSNNFNASASHMNPSAWRIDVDHANSIGFHDAIQGEISQILKTDVGDFILKRKDGFFAYQLAVVVDDAAQGITHVVRGADLLDSTPRQIYLQHLLDFAMPHYAHVPIACNLAGEKLSKQTLAKSIDTNMCSQFYRQLLFEVLSFLGQNPPLELNNITLNEAWRWAITHWNLANVPKLTQIKINA